MVLSSLNYYKIHRGASFIFSVDRLLMCCYLYVFYEIMSKIRCFYYIGRKTVCHIARMKKDEYEGLIASLIENATPLSSSLQSCHQQFIPDTQVCC